ncbi:hypothetical protein HZA38_04165 [Candidatus Peregrinibacteria bacterium]|nr:hypothetical protein [Candidatus Peregrinibacteria bacterium]
MESFQFVSLERRLYEGRKIAPSEDFEESLKAFLFSQMAEKNEKWFLQFVKDLEISSDFAVVKNRIWQNLEHSADSLPFDLSDFLRHVVRKSWFWKSIVAVIFIVGGFLIVPPYLFGSDILPQQFSLLMEAAGEVHIVQGTEESQGKGGEHLSQGQTIQTGEGTAQIVFFDETLFRIGPHSSVTLQKNTQYPGPSHSGEIEVVLEEGKVWLRSFATPTPDMKFVLKSGDILISPLPGTLDVSREARETQIRIWERSAKISDQENKQNTIFVAGSKIRYSPLEGRQEEDLLTEDKNEEWVRKNISDDEIFLKNRLQTLEYEYRNHSGVLPGSFLYPIKIWGEPNLFQGAPADDFYVIEKRIEEVLLLFLQGDEKKALATLEEATFALQAILLEHQELRPLAAQVFNRFQTDLMFLPADSPLWKIRKKLYDTEAEVFHQNPFYFHRNAVEELWNLQTIILESDKLISRKQFETYEFQKSFLPPPITNDPEEKASLLRLKIQEIKLLNFLFFKLFAESNIEAAEDKVIAEILMLIEGKEDIKNLLWEETSQPPDTNPIYDFQEKVKIYKTLQGRKNQTASLLSEVENTARSLPFLQEIRKVLGPELRDVVTKKMGEILEEEEKKIILEAS